MLAALLVGEPLGMVANGNGGNGTSGEAFIDVIGVIQAAMPVAQTVMVLLIGRPWPLDTRHLAPCNGVTNPHVRPRCPSQDLQLLSVRPTSA